jgi:hypothetical protein
MPKKNTITPDYSLSDALLALGVVATVLIFIVLLVNPNITDTQFTILQDLYFGGLVAVFAGLSLKQKPFKRNDFLYRAIGIFVLGVVGYWLLTGLALTLGQNNNLNF